MFRNEPLAAEANLRSFRIVVRVTSGHVCAQAINMRRDSPQVAATGLRAGTGRSLASQTCTCTACAGFCARRDGWVCIRQAATRHDTGAETQRNAADKRLSGVPGPLRTCVHTISTRTRTHMHTRRRTHTHTNADTRRHTHTHTHTHAHTHTHLALDRRPASAVAVWDCMRLCGLICHPLVRVMCHHVCVCACVCVCVCVPALCSGCRLLHAAVRTYLSPACVCDVRPLLWQSGAVCGCADLLFGPSLWQSGAGCACADLCVGPLLCQSGVACGCADLLFTFLRV